MWLDRRRRYTASSEHSIPGDSCDIWPPMNRKWDGTVGILACTDGMLFAETAGGAAPRRKNWD